MGGFSFCPPQKSSTGTCKRPRSFRGLEPWSLRTLARCTPRRTAFDQPKRSRQESRVLFPAAWFTLHFLLLHFESKVKEKYSKGGSKRSRDSASKRQVAQIQRLVRLGLLRYFCCAPQRSWGKACVEDFDFRINLCPWRRKPFGYAYRSAYRPERFARLAYPLLHRRGKSGCPDPEQ